MKHRVTALAVTIAAQPAQAQDRIPNRPAVGGAEGRCFPPEAARVPAHGEAIPAGRHARFEAVLGESGAALDVTAVAP